MKERDFDIILNTCKKRQDFKKKMVDLKRRQDNEERKSMPEGEDMTFTNSEHDGRSTLIDTIID